MQPRRSPRAGAGHVFTALQIEALTALSKTVSVKDREEVKSKIPEIHNSFKQERRIVSLAQNFQQSGKAVDEVADEFLKFCCDRKVDLLTFNFESGESILNDFIADFKRNQTRRLRENAYQPSSARAPPPLQALQDGSSNNATSGRRRSRDEGSETNGDAEPPSRRRRSNEEVDSDEEVQGGAQILAGLNGESPSEGSEPSRSSRKRKKNKDNVPILVSFHYVEGLFLFY